MDGLEDVLLGAGLGAASAVHSHTNDVMAAQGLRVPWPRRHPLLMTFIWMVVLTPLLFLGLYLGPTTALWVATFDQHHGNTGVIDLVIFTSPIWLWGISAYIRAEKRWKQQPPPRVMTYPQYDNGNIIDIQPAAITARPDTPNFP